ncbi:MAG TPA: hypothetical protein EYQ50_06180 [Verrucomicrobiales bacterium]|nr:hypothetical protein [Verrucomicrobiales bacterium]
MTALVEPIAGNYFVAAYPPFSFWNSDQLPALNQILRRPASRAPLGLYVHVPFCQKKCDYCYYLSLIGQPASVVGRYLDNVVKELSIYSRQPAI